MITNDNTVTIEYVASIIEANGEYKTITIASFSEKDGNYLCKLKVPSPRSQSGFTFYPPIDKETPCPTKMEAIVRCLKHIQCTGGINFPGGQADKSIESKSSKKLVIPKRKYSKPQIQPEHKVESSESNEQSSTGSIELITTIVSESELPAPPVIIDLSVKVQDIPDPVPLLF